MLFIRRKKGEAVIINDTIRIAIDEVQGKSVKLSFSYSEGTSVLREEIFERIRQENEKAQGAVSLIEKVLNHG